MSRSKKNALITDPEIAKKHVVKMVQNQALNCFSGKQIPCEIDSIVFMVMVRVLFKQLKRLKMDYKFKSFIKIFRSIKEIYIILFQFNSARRFRSHIVKNSIYSIYRVDNSIRYLLYESFVKIIKVCGHTIV